MGIDFMVANNKENRIFLACGCTDMRKSINGLYSALR